MVLEVHKLRTPFVPTVVSFESFLSWTVLLFAHLQFCLGMSVTFGKDLRHCRFLSNWFGQFS